MYDSLLFHLAAIIRNNESRGYESESRRIGYTVVYRKAHTSLDVLRSDALFFILLTYILLLQSEKSLKTKSLQKHRCSHVIFEGIIEEGQFEGEGQFSAVTASF